MASYDSEAELQALVDEQVPEGTYLEFKSQRVSEKPVDQATNDLATEVSALANSAGGALIIGIEEQVGKDSPSVASGLNGLTNPRWRAEWLSSKLEERIHPAIEGLLVTEVPISAGGWCIVIAVPQSLRAPHQSFDKKYYARRQFQKIAMSHYEVEDVRNRHRVRRPEVKLSIVFSQGVLVELVLENIGDSPVFHLNIVVPDEAKSALNIEAPALTDGISALNPGERLSFHLGTIQQLFRHEILKRDTLIEVLYKHEDGSSGRRFIVFNLSNHDKSVIARTDVDRLRDELSKQLKEVTNSLSRIVEVLDLTLGAIASPTGLSISADTLTRLPGSKDTPKKWNPDLLTSQGFQEVLGCDKKLASRLHRHFQHRAYDTQKLSEVEGLNSETLKKIHERLELPGESLDGA